MKIKVDVDLNLNDIFETDENGEIVFKTDDEIEEVLKEKIIDTIILDIQNKYLERNVYDINKIDELIKQVINQEKQKIINEIIKRSTDKILNSKTIIDYKKKTIKELLGDSTLLNE